MSDRDDHAHSPQRTRPRNPVIVFLGRWRWSISVTLGLAALITLMATEHLWALLTCLLLTVILLILQFRGRDRDAGR